MSQVIIGNTLVKNSLNSLRAGIDLARRLSYSVHVIHTDKLADFDTLDTIFAHLNLDIEKSYIETIIQANEQRLKSQIEKLDIEIDELKFNSYSGSPDDVIVDHAHLEQTKLVVIGHEPNKSWAENFLGSVSESIIHKSPKSILVVKGTTMQNPQKIVLAYDFSHHCDEALVWAKVLQKSFDCELKIVNIIPCYYEGYHLAHAVHDGLNLALEDIIGECVSKIDERLEVIKLSFGNSNKITIDTLIDREGSISDCLNNYSLKQNADLVILGSHKKGKLSDLIMGSISNKVVKTSKSSVLIVK